MRAELSTLPAQSSMLSPRRWTTNSFTEAVSSCTWMPNCDSQGVAQTLNRSISSGTCWRSSGSSFDRMGTISSSTVSAISRASTSTSTTASTRGTPRAARRSTGGCSA